MSPNIIDTRQRSRRINSEEKLIEYIRSSLGAPILDVEITEAQMFNLIDDTIRKFSDFAFAAQSEVAIVIQTQPGVTEYILDPKVQAVTGCSLGGTLGATPSQGNNAGGISLGDFGTIGVGYVPHITLEGEVSSLESGGSSVGSASGVAGGVATGSSGFGKMSDALVSIAHRETFQALFDRAVNWSYNSSTKVLKLFENVSGNICLEANLEYIPNREYDEIYSESWIKEYCVARAKMQWGNNLGKFEQTLIGGGTINYQRILDEGSAEIEKLDEELLSKYSPALGVFSG